MTDLQLYLQDGIFYSLDINKKIAYVYYIKDELEDITIPYSIIYNNDTTPNTYDQKLNQTKNEYIVDGIYPEAFQSSSLISLKFAPNSKLSIIGKMAFFKSSIERLTIPSSLKYLEKGWCAETPRLTSITVSPGNPYFKTMNNCQILIRKSSPNKSKKVLKNNFDTLAFVARNITSFTVPKYIKHIDSDVFERCDKLRTLNFELDSQIQSIGEYCFSQSSIERITIPRSITQIDKKAFFKCYKLEKIVFENGSKLRSIMKNSFSFSAIEKFILPPNIVEINDYAFLLCIRLRGIHIPENSKLQVISDNAFDNTRIGSIFLPPCFRDIGNYTFSNCMNLKIIQINNKIDKKLFLNCNQEILIMVPVETNN